MFPIDVKLLRREIISRGLTLAEFARLSGICMTTVTRIVNNGVASTKVIARLAAFFKIPGDKLIRGGNNEEAA